MKRKAVILFLGLFLFVAGCGETPGETATAAVVSGEQVPTAISFVVQDISVQVHGGRQAAAVTLSSPAATNRPLADWLRIETTEGEALSGAWVADTRGRVLYFTAVEPGKNYRVHVREGLPAAGGATLKEGASALLEFPALQASLGFVGRGLLAYKLKEGLPVMAVNVSRVDVDFYRIPQDKLVDFLARHGNTAQFDHWDAGRLREVEHVYTGRYDLTLPGNTRATRYLPIHDIPSLWQSGVYLAFMREAGQYDYRNPATWFAVTDMGVHLRLYADRMDVHIHGLSDAKPVKGAQVTLLDSSGAVLASHESDAEGLAYLEVGAGELDSGKGRLLLVQKGSDTSLVRLGGPALDLSEFPVTGRTRKEAELFIYSPRDLYRSGETLHFSALLRSPEGEPVSPHVLEARLLQPDGRVVLTRRLSPQPLNAYALSLPLATDAPTGQWRLQVDVPGQGRTEYPFQVETFLPERLSLHLQADKHLDPGQDLRIQMDGRYLYGAPAAGNRLQAQLVSRNNPHPYPAFGDFHFGDRRDGALERRRDLDEVVLDREGLGGMTVASFWEEPASHLSELKAYPYGCLEQTVSGVFPQLYVDANRMAEMGIQGEDEEKRREARGLAIRRIFGMQRHNGGFGFWSSQSQEEPWLTVYATDFLLRARDAGYPVSEPGLGQALDRTLHYLRNASDGNASERFGLRAYAAQVLSRGSQAPLSDMRTLFDHHSKDAAPLSMLQLGLALEKAGDAKRGEEALDRALKGLLASDFGYAPYGGMLRDRALALFWLLESGAESGRWTPLVEVVHQKMTGRVWLSTQERNALFLAGLALLEQPSAPVHLDIRGAFAETVSDDESLERHLSGSSLMQGLRIHNRGTGGPGCIWSFRGMTVRLQRPAARAFPWKGAIMTPMANP